MKKVIFKNRYSETLEPDKIGRWACVAYCGNTKGFKKGRVSFWEIAWIKQFMHEEKRYFVVTAEFPFKAKPHYESLEAAKEAIKEEFKWFIKNCCTISI